MLHNKQEVMEVLYNRLDFTPDINDLKTDYGELIPLFVYDNMMMGHSENYWLDDCPCFGQATTHEDTFILTKSSKDDIILFDEDEDLHSAIRYYPRIDTMTTTGLLYGVPLDLIFSLDVHYENGFRYERTMIPLLLESNNHGLIMVPRVQAYLGIPEYWIKDKTLRLAPRIPLEFDKWSYVATARI